MTTKTRTFDYGGHSFYARLFTVSPNLNAVQTSLMTPDGAVDDHLQAVAYYPSEDALNLQDALHVSAEDLIDAFH